MTFYQVFDSGGVWVLNLEERGLQRRREEAIVDLYHDASNSREPKMFFSYNCIFAQGYCSSTPVNPIVSHLQSFQEVPVTREQSQPSLVFLLFLQSAMLFYTTGDVASQDYVYHSFIGLWYSNQKQVVKLNLASCPLKGPAWFSLRLFSTKKLKTKCHPVNMFMNSMYLKWIVYPEQEQ